MKKDIFVVLGIILVVGAALFWRTIWDYFSGMTAVDAMTQIVTFVLHVTVVTICIFVVTTLPGIVKPWIRFIRQMLRQKQRNMRRQGFGRNPQETIIRRPGLPKPNKDQVLFWMLSQMMNNRRSAPSNNQSQSASQNGNDIHLRF